MEQCGGDKAFYTKQKQKGNAKGGFQPRADSGKPSTSGKDSADMPKKKGKCHYCKKPRHHINECKKCIAKEDTWYFDSGASRHITSRREMFRNLTASLIGRRVTCANNSSYPVQGVGEIMLDGSDLLPHDVLFVPGIKKNLFSVSSFAQRGLAVTFEGT